MRECACVYLVLLAGVLEGGVAGPSAVEDMQQPHVVSHFSVAVNDRAKRCLVPACVTTITHMIYLLLK